jgi:hypothetical protein
MRESKKILPKRETERELKGFKEREREKKREFKI